MPRYEYKCNLCGTLKEIERSYSDTTEPQCCNATMQRVWNATPTIFKTGGFYKTGN